MNIILFYPPEVQLPLSREDPRARHILDTLRRGQGDFFDAGLINGPRGKGQLMEITATALVLRFTWADPPPPLAPLHVIVGLPRPQTARDLLREGAALGVARMDFVRTEKGEAGYAASSLWSSREWERLLAAGAAQAFCTRLPEVRHGLALSDALAAATGTRLALDNYESAQALGALPPPTLLPVTLALGPERGWSDADRRALRDAGFAFVHLGERVLRLETACIAAVAVLRAKLGSL